ncbi:MAG TPA: DUF885 family protein, partial [Rheinheimera sp.]|nr:DUF885 family protein [Rheinheimera sp.]
MPIRPFFAAIAALLLTNQSHATSASEQLQQLLAEHWQQANKEQIFFRKDPDTFRMNGQLPDVSAQGRERRQQFNRQMQQKAEKIELSQLTAAERITLRLFNYERATEAESYQQFDYMFPMQAYSGYHSYFAGAVDNMSFLTTADYDNYLLSLADFPRYNQQHITNLKQAIAKGYTHYCDSFAGYDKTISKHLVANVTDSVFYAPLAKQPPQFSAKQRQHYLNAGTRLISETVLPEYEKLHHFFTSEYMPACRKVVGISELADGKAYYQYLINFYTTTAM